MTESQPGTVNGGEPGPDAASQPAPEGRAVGGVGRRRAPSSAWFAGLLLLALTGLAFALGLTRSSPAVGGAAAQTPSQQQAALAAARAEGAAITTLSWRTANSDLDRILAGALPKSQLYQQFAAQRAQLPSLLKKNQSVSRGTVLASGLSSMTGDQAKVMVAVDAAISGKSGAPIVKHYRMVFTMQHTGRRWLASDVGFAGSPQ